MKPGVGVGLDEIAEDEFCIMMPSEEERDRLEAEAIRTGRRP
jgi:hypothetical protein